MKFEIIKKENVDCTITPIHNIEGVFEFEIEVKYPSECVPKPIVIKWKDEMKDMYSLWHSRVCRDRTMHQSFCPTVVDSKFYFQAPLFGVLGFNGENKTLVALSDAIKPHTISFGILDHEQEDKVGFEVTLFDNYKESLKEDTVLLRIDKRDISFVQATKDAKEWWEKELSLNYFVPEAAEMPLYSTWYNFHQNPKQDILLEELKIASEMGFKTVIIDDGWHFAKSGVGCYSKCGDWEVSEEKFYDFNAFVEKVHQLGIKVMIWIPVPFVGSESLAYKRFSDKLLYHDGETIGILDARYKEVREHLVNTYLSFAQRYNLDGLKLDFIDCFKIMPETPPYNDEMDYSSLEKAVCALLEEVNKKLKAWKQDFLIEFRQNYVGPEILRYGNMLRVGDCAYDSIVNRVGIVDLRLVSKDVAVHSDMLYWSPAEKLEHCGIQLLNVMFSVPQISVRLTENTPEQLQLLKNFIKYWTENRNTLLHGQLEFSEPEISYSAVSCKDEKKKITVLYAKNSYIYTQGEEDVFNATCNEFLYIENTSKKEICVEVYDCLGELKSKQNYNAALIKVQVSMAGYCKIKS